MMRLATLVVFASPWFICLSTYASEPAPLHARIDEVLRASNVKVAAPIASDGDFLRRLYLDLTGAIPSLDVARAFLADTAADKRQRTVDELLGSRAFARHMATTFDVMLMERRPEKHIKQPEWKAYLFQNFVANRPLNELFAELLNADGLAGPARPAARFLMDRDCDPNLLTRDVGRIVFGRDYQCAQCHDHPLIDDYAQADYYGLYAFLHRSYVFTSKDQKTVAVAEKGEGDAIFKSVFLPEIPEKLAIPHVPGGGAVTVPVLAKHAAYQVAPADDVRPIPKYSLRAQLALEATRDNRIFARNLANRLWGQMMPHPIVDPPDLHHSANGPIHPELLELLTTAILDVQFDLRAFLREIALCNAYQRSQEVPFDVLLQQTPEITAELQADQQELERLTGEIAPAKAEFDNSTAAIAGAQTAYQTAYETLVGVTKPWSDLDQQRVTLETEFATTRQQRASLVEARTAVLVAMESTAQAAVVFSEDRELAQALAVLGQRQLALGTQIVEVDAKLAAQQGTIDELMPRLHAARQAVTDQETLVKSAQEVVQQAQQAGQACATAFEQREARRQTLLRRVSDAQRVLELVALHAQSSAGADNAAATESIDALYGKLAERWELGYATAELKALTPEQFAQSALVATGEHRRLWDATRSEWIKKYEEQQQAKGNATCDAVSASESEGAKVEIEEALHGKVEAQVGPFIQLFGAAAGQPQNDFFATADQALFVSNSGYLRGWSSAQEGNLAHHLSSLSDNPTVANEMFLAVFTRPPFPEEIEEVDHFLQQHTDNRAVAIRELLWSLLASPEFRFRR